MMKRICCILLTAAAVLMLAGCGAGEKAPGSYRQISMEEAVSMMERETDYILLDVRTQDEYAQGHIPGAILIPDYEISEKAESVLTDKDQLILVYCRSGRRSKNAAAQLEEMGYTRIREFGGILDWPYETE